MEAKRSVATQTVFREKLFRAARVPLTFELALAGHPHVRRESCCMYSAKMQQAEKRPAVADRLRNTKIWHAGTTLHDSLAWHPKLASSFSLGSVGLEAAR